MALFRRNTPPAPVDLNDLAGLVAAAVKSALPATAFEALPRTEFGPGWLGSPGLPLVPQGIDPREPDTGRPAPRRSEFPQSINMQLASRFVPFTVLRDVADRVDVIRRCIETRKSQMLALDWDITLSKQAIKRVMLDNNVDSPGEAAQIARAEFAPAIARLRAWWEKPDRINSMDWTTWLSVMLEEHLVLDALSVYPRRRMAGDVVAFEIIDGSTIKPLLDHRGSTPQSPNPAYQQILYGFPRGEFTASDFETDSFQASQLIYRPRIRRSFTPYGMPDTESALSSADLWLKRMSWIREEFTEGTTPDTWMKPPKDSKMQPDQIKAWETALNAELAAAISERRKLRAAPPGWEPQQMATFADRYKPELDELIVKLLCASFSVMPTEIGFPPGGGIGGKGHQEGEANSSHRRAVRPTATWIESVCTDISREYLDMPVELQFSLLGWETEDQNADEQVADSRSRRGAVTLNEDRAKRGLPLYSFAEADTPFIVTGSGLVFLEGAIAAQAAAGQGAGGAIGAPAPMHELEAAPSAEPASAIDPRPTNNPIDDIPEVGDPIGEDEPVPEGFIRVQGHLRRKQQPATPAAVDEAAKFVTFARRRAGAGWRDFKFEHVDTVVAAQLNEAGRAGDIGVVKRLVVDLGKAKARRVSRADKQTIVDHHAPKIAAAIRALLPSPAALVAGYTASKSVDSDAAEAYMREQLDVDETEFDDLDGEIEDFVKAGHQSAWSAAWVGDEEDDEVPDGEAPGRLAALLDSVPDLRDTLIAGAIGLAVDALTSTRPEENLTDVLGTAEFVDTFASVELTATCTAGTLDAAEAQNLVYVQLVVGGGECDFCQGYDGRIMSIDDDEGMPPLHNGCQCDVEPLD